MEFEEKWQAGTVQGWEDKGVGNGQSTTKGNAVVDVDDYDTIEELMDLGPERLKEVSYQTSLMFPSTHFLIHWTVYQSYETIYETTGCIPHWNFTQFHF